VSVLLAGIQPGLQSSKPHDGWVGHKDGGILIGKVYGHLSNEQAQAQAARLNFGPAIVTMPQAANA
jgi:hypothetical protein